MDPVEVFNQAWDILTMHAGALDDEDVRTDFVTSFLRNRRLTEWRFGGTLGMGGKFWRYDGRYYVTCYPEDRTGSRIDTIDRVNHLLATLPYHVPV
jgi:hypothetical protein